MSEKIVDLAREAQLWEMLECFSGEFGNGHAEEDCLPALTRFAELVNNDFKNRLAEAIEQMPFGDTASSFAAYVRNFK